VAKLIQGWQGQCMDSALRHCPAILVEADSPIEGSTTNHRPHAHDIT
jgi:hypothetical protein